MRQGTPGFVGDRLREAREARGVSAASLASRLGVSRQAISQYENGSVSPHPEVMKQLAEVLNLPALYFCRPGRPVLSSPLHFRSLAKATVAARRRSEGRFGWLLDIAGWINSYVELPAPNFPDLVFPADPAVVTSEQIEEAAAACRRYWGLGDGPLGHLVRIMERNGVIVALGAAAEDVDAFSTWVDGVPYVFLGTEKSSAARGRFNAAHELGHLVLHRNVDRVTASKSEVHLLMEDQANRFAGALLLPAQQIARDLRGVTMPYFQALKPKWVVSIGAMIYRAQTLGLVSKDQGQRLWKHRARLGWNTQEPWDDQIPVEEPFLLKRSIELILTEEVVAKEDILSELPLAPADIEELGGLPPGLLSKKANALRVLHGNREAQQITAFSRKLTRIK